jgi:hypothetical protein
MATALLQDDSKYRVELTTDHSQSRNGIPVLLVIDKDKGDEGVVYSRSYFLREFNQPAEKFVRTWQAAKTKTDLEWDLATKFLAT